MQNQADILSTVEQTSGTCTTLLGSIAAISLVVGGIGIFFGLYPATRAAALNPIDALRYE